MGLLLGLSATTATANNADLPRVMVWTAYGTGAAGYAQAAALGGLLKFEAGSNIRILPGRNDVSRMIPLKTGRADYCLCGIASYFGQEGIFLFNKPDWGPQPIRMVLASQGHPEFRAGCRGRYRSQAPPRPPRSERRVHPRCRLHQHDHLGCTGLRWFDVG